MSLLGRFMELRKFNATPDFEESVESVLEEIKNTKTKNSSSNIHKNHRARLKNQYSSNGFSSLTDIQKLELLLFYAIPQKDTNPIAHELINHFGSLKDVFAASKSELMTINGVKENTATLICLMNDFANFSHLPSNDTVIGSSAMAKEYSSKLYHGVEVEQFYVMCLTASNKVKKCTMVKSGKIDEVNVQIRNITEIAIESKCSRIIISHNHPAGKAEMSDEDCRFTYGLLCSCILNNIEILDHVIVGTNKTISLAEQNILPRLKAHAIKNIQLPKERADILAEQSKPYIIDIEN